MLLGYYYYFFLKRLTSDCLRPGPRVMLPGGNLLLRPVSADGSHFPQHGLLLLSCVCVMDWPGYFGEGDVTTWEEEEAMIDGETAKWVAVLPSRIRRRKEKRQPIRHFSNFTCRDLKLI